jgi:hypothetical protein
MESAARWDELCSRYLRAFESADMATLEVVFQEAIARLPHLQPAEWDWFRVALTDSSRVWYVGNILRTVDHLPADLLDPMLRAALEEPSPGKRFLEPCLRSFGPRVVIEYLLERLEHGEGPQRFRASRLLYEAEASLHYQVARIQADLSLVREETHGEEFADLWARKRNLELRAFVTTADPILRRATFPIETFEHPEWYPSELQSLIPLAHELAQTDSDEIVYELYQLAIGRGQTVTLYYPEPIPSLANGPDSLRNA